MKRGRPRKHPQSLDELKRLEEKLARAENKLDELTRLDEQENSNTERTSLPERMATMPFLVAWASAIVALEKSVALEIRLLFALICAVASWFASRNFCSAILKTKTGYKW